MSDCSADGNHPPKRLKVVKDAFEANPNRKARLRAGKADALWKKQGHLPRPPTLNKYVGGALEVPTLFKVESQPIKAGGYSTLARAVACGEDPKTPEAAVKMGLTLVPYMDL